MDEIIRALLGSLLVVGTMVCCVFMLYKYAICQQEQAKEKKRFIRVQSNKIEPIKYSQTV